MGPRRPDVNSQMRVGGRDLARTVVELKSEGVHAIAAKVALSDQPTTSYWSLPTELSLVSRPAFRSPRSDRLIPIVGDPNGCYSCPRCGSRRFEPEGQAADEWELQLHEGRWRVRDAGHPVAQLWRDATVNVHCLECWNSGVLIVFDRTPAGSTAPA
jgi:hypothetical protein